MYDVVDGRVDKADFVRGRLALRAPAGVKGSAQLFQKGSLVTLA